MFNNKIVLITGGSSGIGEAIALMFAEKGADVAITYKSNKEGADRVINKIQSMGKKAVAFSADLGEEEQVKKVIEAITKEFGTIDILVNNAGRYVDGDVWDGPAEVWMKSLQQNLISVMNVSKYVAQIFQQKKTGIMINISSRHGLSGVPNAPAYAAAKAGVINITQTYSKLLAPFGRVNCVAPSATDAGYWHIAPKEELEAVLAGRPNHKLVEPKTVAEKIVFLASDESKDITGQVFPVTE